MNSVIKSIKKIKLLVGITLSEMGGSQKVVYDIIANLPKEKYDITLVTRSGGELIEWINKLNNEFTASINIITIDSLCHQLSPLNDLKSLLKLYGIIRKGKYDIAHFHTAKIGLLGRLAATFARVPQILYTVHGLGMSAHLSPLMRCLLSFAERVGAKLSSKVIYVCKHDMDIDIQKKSVSTKKAELIYNGISETCEQANNGLHKQLGIPEGTYIVATTMRLKAPKVPLFTIRVMNEVLKKIDNVKFVIMGDGVLREKCESLINSLGANNDIFLLGTRDDVRLLLDDIDVFLLFSISEGLPISIIEAMFSGKPIVSNNVGGIPELVEHDVNGYLIENLDVGLASEYVIRLLCNKSLRNKMGNAGKQKALEAFSLQTMLDKYQSIYCMESIKNDIKSFVEG